MIHQIYSVFDDAANTFMPPWYQNRDALAMRVFSDACRQEDHPFNQNPQDFHLYHLGNYDDETGRLENVDKPALLLKGSDVRDAAAEIIKMEAKQ